MLLPGLATADVAFVDPLDQQAQAVAPLERQPLRDIVNTGQRLVAVGDNGLIIFSDDQGQQWTQAEVTLSVDLNAVFFANPQQGWAVGHGAAILHSSDGGEHWEKQLDGRDLEAIFVDYFTHDSGLEAERAQRYLSAILSMTRPGPGQFFMGVWFDRQGREGLAVGPFGLILASQDGGASWTPYNTQIDNNDLLHLTSVREIDRHLLITGERGRIWQRDRDSGRFLAADTGYEWTLFGVTGSRQALLAYGLRGRVFRSTDQGSSWQAVSSDLSAGVTGGTALGERAFVLVSQSAQVALSRDKGHSFSLLDIAAPTLFTGVVEISDSRLAMVGLGGVTTLDIQ